MTGVFLRNCLESFFAVRDLLHPTLAIQILDGRRVGVQQL
jgi:hypothetical protein